MRTYILKYLLSFFLFLLLFFDITAQNNAGILPVRQQEETASVSNGTGADSAFSCCSAIDGIGGEGYSLPSYVVVLGDDQDAIDLEIPDSVFYSIAGRTIFKVNKTDLNTSDPFIIELSEKVLPLARRRGWALVGMRLRGAASPEGPYWNNRRLSIGRAAALRRFLSENLVGSTIADEAPQSTIAEDYPALVWVMEEASDRDAERVRAIVAATPDNPEEIKSRLRALDGGRLWERLLRDYYPGLRAARVVLMFRKFPLADVDAQMPTLEVAIEKPAALVPLHTFDNDRSLILPRKHLLSVSSNLLYDAFYLPQYGWAPSPNINIEFYPRSGNWTFRAGFMFPYYHRWSHHKFYQIFDYHLEVRRYFNPGWSHTGPYLAAYANWGKYGIGFSKTKGWEGEGIGGAVKAGWEVPLGNSRSRWRLDFHVALGTYITRYDPYVYGNPITGYEDGDYYYDYTGKPSEFKRRNHRLTWFGPTEVGITLTFDVLYYRRLKNGVSFIGKEVVF